MTFLPIVQRELRVAARRRSTYRIRYVAASLAALMGALFLLGSMLPGRVAPSGRGLFLALVYSCLGLALLAGVLLTADCLSREKRDGTLGLLFLTDLDGVDVVAGKLAGLSLVPLHGLLAVFPIAAMTIFLGGVTGGELGRALLVVLNTMFLSLSLGLCVSSIITEERKAVGLTLCVLAFMTLVPSMFSWLPSAFPGLSAAEIGRLASPAGMLAQGFEDSHRTAPERYWLALVFHHGLAWLFFIVAALVTRKGWRAVDVKAARPAHSNERVLPRPFQRVRTWRRGRQLRQGHLAWLAWQDRWVRRGAWWVAALTLAAASLTFLVLAVSQQRLEAGSRAMMVVAAGLVVLKLLLAIHAAHFLHDSCRSGAMELLVVTPITSRALCHGHLSALRQAFLWPFLTMAIFQIGLSIGGKFTAGSGGSTDGARILAGLVPAVLTLAVHALDLLAVAYHASRWALYYDRPSKALLRTAILVLFLPNLFCSYGRIVIDLIVIGQTRPMLDRFRDLVRGWYFPGILNATFGSPRVN